MQGTKRMLPFGTGQHTAVVARFRSRETWRLLFQKVDDIMNTVFCLLDALMLSNRGEGKKCNCCPYICFYYRSCRDVCTSFHCCISLHLTKPSVLYQNLLEAISLSALVSIWALGVCCVIRGQSQTPGYRRLILSDRKHLKNKRAGESYREGTLKPTIMDW